MPLIIIIIIIIIPTNITFRLTIIIQVLFYFIPTTLFNGHTHLIKYKFSIFLKIHSYKYEFCI